MSEYQDFQIAPGHNQLDDLRPVTHWFSEYDQHIGHVPFELHSIYLPYQKARVNPQNGKLVPQGGPVIVWTIMQLTYEQSVYFTYDFPSGSPVTIRTRTGEPDVFSILNATIIQPRVDASKLPRIPMQFGMGEPATNRHVKIAPLWLYRVRFEVQGEPVRIV